MCHVKDNVPGAYYIGRNNHLSAGRVAGKFANPYRIGDEHDSLQRGQKLTREHVISYYFSYLTARPFLLRRLPELRGKPLECWCRRKGEPKTKENQCHGDVILHLLDKYTDDELRDMR